MKTQAFELVRTVLLVTWKAPQNSFFTKTYKSKGSKVRNSDRNIGVKTVTEEGIKVSSGARGTERAQDIMTAPRH